MDDELLDARLGRRIEVDGQAEVAGQFSNRRATRGHLGRAELGLTRIRLMAIWERSYFVQISGGGSAFRFEQAFVSSGLRG